MTTDMIGVARTLMEIQRPGIEEIGRLQELCSTYRAEIERLSAELERTQDALEFQQGLVGRLEAENRLHKNTLARLKTEAYEADEAASGSV